MNTTSRSWGSRGRGFTLIELLVVVAILGILALLVGQSGINWSNGTGTKVGQVVKLSKQGMMSKTWEGQIIRGGMSGGSGGFGTVPFDFTVETEAEAKQVEAYMEKQAEVKLSYRIEGFYSLFRSESHGHFLTSIEPITNAPPTVAR